MVERVRDESGQDRIDILAECTGGVIARHYIQSLGGDEYVRRMVTFVSPQNGVEKTFYDPEIYLVMHGALVRPLPEGAEDPAPEAEAPAERGPEEGDGLGPEIVNGVPPRDAPAEDPAGDPDDGELVGEFAPEPGGVDQPGVALLPDGGEAGGQGCEVGDQPATGGGLPTLALGLLLGFRRRRAS